MTIKQIFCGTLLSMAGCCFVNTCLAQQEKQAVEAVVVQEGAAAVPAGPDGKAGPRPGRPGPQPGQPGGPGQPGALPQGDAKPGEAKPGEPAKDAGPKTTARPQKPDAPPNPEELKVRPDANGRVRFNFHGQPWLEVLEWLAKISDLSLDWQEVPGDFLNLRTQRSYTLDEARDLINRHLLDRGFSLLRHGEVLSVVNLKKLDPSLVPRVSPDALDDCQDHEFVKVSFPLDSLIAEGATEELKPMLSPNGKLTALKTTNRIEALDAAVNLREIRDMLASEQSQRSRKRLVREFRLEFTRASEVMEQLQELLGIDKKPATPQAGGRMNPEQMAMQQQQQMMMMQAQQQQGGKGGMPGMPKQPPSVHMVVNPKENSIVAQAPADQMAVITEAVKIIDVPSARSPSFLKNMSRTQVYRLAAVDPEALVKMLQELGDLDPTTRLQVDKVNRSIIAYASLADHLTIRTLVNKLDGTDRRFEVIKLRRLEADYVAGTIEFMMGAGEKKKQQNNRYSPYWDFYGFGGGRNAEQDESRKFRVDADVEHNRLLLWVNPVELEEVNHLLVKLGEIPGEGGNLSTLRILDTIPPEDVAPLLERLKRTWPGVGPNPLEIAPGAEAEVDDADEQAPPPTKKSPRAKPRVDETTTETKPRAGGKDSAEVSPELLRLMHAAEELALSREEGKRVVGEPATSAEEEEDADSEDATSESSDAGGDTQLLEGEEPVRAPGAIGPRDRTELQPRKAVAASPSPIRLGRGPDGRLVISSPDTLALDRLEDLLIEIAPPRKDYKIFKMKFKSTWAYGVALNLKDFFEEKDKNDKRQGRFGFWGYPQNNSNEDDRRLSKRRPLKFISDSDSNSILVTGADANQLKVIEELIDLYDVPESKDSASVRKTKIVKIRYSKARVVADAVKDVYRDLLSVNDPALQNNQNNNQKQKPPDAMYTYIYSSGEDDKKPDSPAKFKGLLSIGVDELSNTLVVSAAEGLMENVVATAEALDEAARPMVNRMKVMKIDRNIDANELQKRLKNLVTRPPQPQQKQPQQPHQPQQQGQQLPPDNSTIVIEN